ncbi:homeobox expressed in ES cells 1-like [Actinia tenebrosa]|uniref:Homeobox expressed in ES cells 1-like n=1 Tax=Actinia tenebrosa TaxID=6105 RepID=A0A6P8HU48_ACTTE|nr:homeobox expressed in ES cells 1-like [Actinia tenebrosa]
MEGAEQQTVQSPRQGFSIAALLGTTSRQQPHRPKPERALHGQLYSQEYHPHSLNRMSSSFDVGPPMHLPRTLWESLPEARGIAHQGTSTNIVQLDRTRERRKSKDSSKKRTRTAFTNHQIKVLESEFKSSRYLTVSRRNELAKLLELSDNQIKIWFQNRRTKLKRQIAVDIAFSMSLSGHFFPCHPTMHTDSHCPRCVFKMPSWRNYSSGATSFDGPFCHEAGFSSMNPQMPLTL